MAKIIAIANHKGGVGKTTTTANLGAALARMGRRVLLVDIDSQQSLTSSLMDESQVEVSIYDSIKDGAPLPIVEVGTNLHLVPADVDLALADIELASLTLAKRGAIFKNLLAGVSDGYDYILIDCPPSLCILTLSALAAATDLYLPLTAEGLPLRGLANLERAVAKIIPIGGVLLTRFNNRRLNKDIVTSIGNQYGDKMFRTIVRENISLAEAPMFHQSIFDYAPESNGAKDYLALAEEVERRVNK